MIKHALLCLVDRPVLYALSSFSESSAQLAKFSLVAFFDPDEPVLRLRCKDQLINLRLQGLPVSIL